MKNILLILCILILSSSCTIKVQTGVIETTYDGTFDYSFHDGRVFDCDTIFSIDDEKALNGNYYYIDQSKKRMEGAIKTITNKHIVNKNQLNIDWYEWSGKNKWEGQVHMKTDDNWESFSGEWYFKGKKQGIWSGKIRNKEKNIIKSFIEHHYNK